VGGFITGAILSGLVLAAVSLMTQTPVEAPPRAAGLEVPTGSGFNQPRKDSAAQLPAADATPGEHAAAPRVVSPEPDDLRPLAAADTAPAAAPETGDAQTTLPPPQGAGETSGPTIARGQGTTGKAAEAGAPGQGQADDLSIATEPAQPVLPEIEQDSGMGMERPASGANSEREPSGTIGNIAQGVMTDRLPTVTETEAESAAVGESAPDRATDGAAATGQADGNDAQAKAALPALEKFAARFENPEGKPLMSIILIDHGKSPISFDALADFPYPISYAIDVDWPGAAEAAKTYRAAGLEVLALTNLPQTATPVDVEVAMQTALDAVPGAVAVMEGEGSGLQSSRATLRQLIPILRESGQGLVLFPEGLDTGRKLIARAGVPAVTLFRDIDGEGQTASAIRRALDQAAFRATQQKGGVVVVGRLRAETISALLLWGLQDRANRVAPAPISAVLLANRITKKQ